MNLLDNSDLFEYPDLLLDASTLDGKVRVYIADNPGNTFAEFLASITAEASLILDDIQNGNITDETTGHILYGFAAKSVADVSEKTGYLDTVREYAKLSWERVTRFRVNIDTDTTFNVSALEGGNLPDTIRKQMKETREWVEELNGETAS